MASVLLCEDERLARQVAVKRLHADSPVDVEQRFTREAKLGASLNHPNLVSVFDTATDDEGVLIVMEYVEGEPLSRMLRRGPLRPEEVASMVRDLGDALDHAHSQGVVHRDVKPGNVLIREDGVTKLADLGIATASDGTKITRSGTVLGTAAYMAPEQLDGRGAGPPADVYALAAIAFEALSGRRPREGRTPLEIAHRIATEGAPDLLDAWPSAPKAAAEVLRRGMALEPEDRPASAGEFARELATALEAPPEDLTAKTRRLGGRGSKRRRGGAGRRSRSRSSRGSPRQRSRVADPRRRRRRARRRAPIARRTAHAPGTPPLAPPSTRAAVAADRRRRTAGATARRARASARRRHRPGSRSSSRSPSPRSPAPCSRAATTRAPRRRAPTARPPSPQGRRKKEKEPEGQEGAEGGARARGPRAGGGAVRLGFVRPSPRRCAERRGLQTS